jgi:phosphoribosylaminoimidazolecarboxamide formyltransferase / IMP cyclohydrolase
MWTLVLRFWMNLKIPLSLSSSTPMPAVLPLPLPYMRHTKMLLLAIQFRLLGAFWQPTEEMNSLFFEILIAPDFTEEALVVLKSKKNRILLKRKEIQVSKMMFKTLLNGVLEQDKDLSTEKIADFKTVTEKAPTESELKALEFALKICKHTKSNTIILAKEGQLLASGVGQTSRVDALKQAIEKAGEFGFDLQGSVMASDAFFPFPDCVEIAHKAGITAVTQPGGSIKDKDSIAYCDANGVAMVMTGVRHFKH